MDKDRQTDRGRHPSDQARSAEIVTVRPTATTMTRQHLPYFVGISGATAGARGLSLNLVIIPPGAHAQPHYHSGYETAIYILRGRVETRYGPELAKSIINEAGTSCLSRQTCPISPSI